MFNVFTSSKLRPWWLALAVACALAGCERPQPSVSEPRADANGDLRFGTLTFKPCSLSPALGDAVEAQCATFAVPENYAAPAGRKIELAVMLIPATSRAEPDPIVFIAGGPGQAISDAYPMLHGAMADARRSRNVLLVDARGTGRSHPLQCPQMIEAMGKPELLDTVAQVEALTRACRDTLAKTADLRFYGTRDHVRDLDAVRRALGIDKLNLVGISYGTRVAQQFAAAYPAHVRTVTLDSVAPNSMVFGEHSRNFDAAMKQQFALCAKDPVCLKNLGDPLAVFARVRAKLEAGGLPVLRYRDPRSGEWREETPSYEHLRGLLQMYLYDPRGASTLALTLHEADQGRYESLLAQSRGLSGRFGEMIAVGMHLSVICSEDFEFRLTPEYAQTLAGSEALEFRLAQCALWPKGERAPNFRTPLGGDVPVLAMSGEYDPVTPPRYGDEVVKTLPKGSHLVLRGQGHNVIFVGCMPKLFARFLETANAKTLDASCLNRLQPSPPFVGPYGWEP